VILSRNDTSRGDIQFFRKFTGSPTVTRLATCYYFYVWDEVAAAGFIKA
jgi:hypothetical protein